MNACEWDDPDKEKNNIIRHKLDFFTASQIGRAWYLTKSMTDVIMENPGFRHWVTSMTVSWSLSSLGAELFAASFQHERQPA